MSEHLLIEAVDPSRVVRLPHVSESRQDAVFDELLALRESLTELGALVPCGVDGCLDPGHSCGSVQLAALAVPVLEDCLAEPPDRIDPVLAAEFALFVGVPGIAETFAVQIAFGEPAGWMNVQDLTRLVSRAQRRDMSVDDYVADLVDRGEVPKTPVARTLHGETHHRPDDERIRRGIVMLRYLAALLPEVATPVCLGIIGWLQWARGKRALGLAYLAEAQLVAPMNQTTYGMTWLVSTKTPRWVSDDAHSPDRE